MRDRIHRLTPRTAASSALIAVLGLSIFSGALYAAPTVSVQTAAPQPAQARSPESSSESAHRDPASEPSREGWSRFEVERNGWSKKVRFRDLESSELRVMKYKGIPYSRISAVNIVVPEDRYDKNLHRVRYRLTHPLSGDELLLRARAKSHAVRGVPIRSEDTEPVIEIFDRGEDEPRGSLRYDYSSRVLFAGTLGERRVEIERVSADTALDRGALKLLLFPYPLEGEFVARLDGEEVARWAQQRQRGVKAPYELLLVGEDRPELRHDALLAFIVFDLMEIFVSSAD